MRQDLTRWAKHLAALVPMVLTLLLGAQRAQAATSSVLTVATTVSTTGTCPGQQVVNVLPGTALTWCYVATNLGPNRATQIQVTDSAVGAISPVESVLSVGQSFTWTRADVASTGLMVSATASGTDQLTGATVTSAASAASVNVVGPRVAVDVTVTTSGSCPGVDVATVQAGTSVRYCYTVSNVGTDNLLDVDLVDQTGATVASVASLPVAESQTFVGAATIVTAQAQESVTATATDPFGFDVSATDLAQVDVTYPVNAPAISVVTTVSTTGTCPGQAIVNVLKNTAVTWCYAVTNIGDTTLQSGSLTDTVNGQISTQAFGLYPGQVLDFTHAGVAGASVTATATATAIDTVSGAIVKSATDSAAVNVVGPKILLQVTTTLTGTCPGSQSVTETTGSVQYCYVVGNTGNDTLDNITIVDGTGATVGTLASLAPSRGHTFESAPVAITANTTESATATATDTFGFTVTSSGMTKVTANAPNISLVKTVSINGSCPGVPQATVMAGTAGTYCYLVVNAGQTSLSSVVVNDNGVTLAVPNLAVGASFTVSQDVTLQASADTAATASGTAPGGVVVTSGSSYAELDVTSNPPPGPSCTDKIKDGTESDVDCGGQCPMACAAGQTCNYDTDCIDNDCVAGVCQIPSVLDSTCTNDGTNAKLHNGGWPYHETGSCADGYDPFTILDAAALCPGGVVKYYDFGCTDFPQPPPALPQRSWEADYSCCVQACTSTSCDDNDPCTVDACNPTAGCTHTAYACAAPDQCHQAGTCNGDGSCSYVAVPDGTACNDGNACTQTDTCQAGVCTGGNPVACAPSDACHVAGACNPPTGACSNPPAADGAACDDGNACTDIDVCTSGVCAGTAYACATPDQCHQAGTCNGDGTCSFANLADGTACNDGNACTDSDVCTGGVCGGTAYTCPTPDQCHQAGTCNGDGTCSNPAATDGTACNDGNACTDSDVCTGGVCAGSAYSCAAPDQCHQAGACNGDGTCSFAGKANGTACNDGNACTQNDVCTGGVCAGTAYTCAAPDQCHQAGTCNGDGTCSFADKSNGTACNDGNPCTQTDTCQAGVCTGSNPVACAASDQCHVAGTCNTSTGACSNPAATNGTACNDGDACTQTDTCQAGVCTGSNPVACTASDPCHTAGTCNPSTGTCSNPNAANGTACNDGNACTQNDTCQAGVCTGSNPVACTASDPCHTAGTCNTSTGACSNPAATNGTACNDGNACTQNDVCTAGVCAGTAYTCAAPDQCHQAGTCNGDGTCSFADKADGTACNDGNACTQPDTCQAGACTGGGPVNCDDGNACTVDACTPATGCTHTALSCAVCAPATGCLNPALSIVKTVSTSGACPGQPLVTVLVGAQVTYCYAVTNTGDTAVNGVVVSDNGATVPVGDLAPGAAGSGTATITALADMTTPAVASGTVAATGTPVASPPSSATVDVVAPALSISVTVSTSGTCPGDKVINVEVGTPATWCYVVTNSGNTPVEGVTATDAYYGAVPGSPATLSPGESVTFSRPDTAAVDITLYASAAGTATVTDTPVQSPQDLAVIDVVSPDIEIDVTVSPSGTCPGVDSATVPAGTSVVYCYLVSNNGDDTLSGVQVENPSNQLVGTIGTLAPGDSQMITGQAVVVLANGSATGTATGTDVYGYGVTATDTAIVQALFAGISIQKTVSVDGSCPGTALVTVLVGTPVTYCYTVTNNGGVALTGVDVTDNGFTLPAGNLAPGQSATVLRAITATVDESTPATASGLNAATNAPVVSAPSVATVDVVSPSLAIQKTVSLDGTCPGVALVDVLAGTPVTYCYAVTNTGDTTITGVTVSDNGVTIPIGTLAPDQVGSGSAPYVSTNTDTTTAAVASGTDSATGTPVSSPPSAATVDVVHPALSIVTTVSTSGACPGAPIVTVETGTTVTWCYAVTNTGDVPVAGITVTDNVYGSVPGAAFTLAPGQSTTLSRAEPESASTTVTAAAAGTDTVVGSAVQSNQSSAAVNVVSPAIAISVTVSTNGACPGAPSATVVAGSSVLYCYVVSNPTTDALFNVGVYDQNEKLIGTIGDLPAGASSTLVGAPLTVTAQNSATGVAQGVDAFGFAVSATGSAIVYVIYADVAVQVAAPATLTENACPTLPYTITVTSDGQATANSTVMTDTLPAGVSFVSAMSNVGSCNLAGGTVTCSLGHMAPGATATIVVTTTPTVSSGSITNTVHVTTTTMESNSANNSAGATTQISAPALASWEAIPSNFNGTAIPAGSTIWFTAAMKVNGLPKSGTASVYSTAGTIAFTAGGKSYNVAVPSSKVTFSSSATVASTTFNTATNQWITVSPMQWSGNVLLTAVELPVTTAIPGGANPVTWSTFIASNTTGVSVNWQWAAAVYTSFSTSYGALELQPTDDNNESPFKSSDHAGTPEAYKQFVTGGARGGGGSNYSGSLSSTAGGTPVVEACP